MSLKLSPAERGIAERVRTLHATLHTLPLSARDGDIEVLCRDTVALQRLDVRRPSQYLAGLHDRTDRIMATIAISCGQDARTDELAGHLSGRSLALGLLPLFREGFGAEHLVETIRDALTTNQGPPVWGAALSRLLRETGDPRAIATSIARTLTPFYPYDDMLIRLTEPDRTRRRASLDVILTDAKEAIDFTLCLSQNRTRTAYYWAAWTMLLGAAEVYGIADLLPQDCSSTLITRIIDARLTNESGEGFAGLRAALKASGLALTWVPILEELSRGNLSPEATRRIHNLLDELRPM